MINILVIYPPKIEYIFSIQKHYTDFGETISYLDNEKLFNVDVMDGTALIYFQFDFIKAYSKAYDYLIIYTDLHNSITAMKTANLCKKISPQTKIISFGQGAPYAKDIYINNGFDAVVFDTLDYRMIKNYILLDKKIINDNKNIKGIYYKNDNKIIKIEKISKIEDINELPFPNLSKLPTKKYKEISGRNQLCITVAKGCPFNCNFCRVPINEGNNVKYKNIDDILNFIILNIKNFESVKLIAPTFTANRKWVIKFCKKIIEKNIRFKWVVTTVVKLLDEELIHYMSKAGCIAIAFGLETISINTQKVINKIQPLEDVKKVAFWMHKYSITPKAFIMLGIPNQTKDEILLMYKFLNDNKIQIRPKEFYPYNKILTVSYKEKLEYLEKFERFEVYENKIKDISTKEFISLLTNRTRIG